MCGVISHSIFTKKEAKDTPDRSRERDPRDLLLRDVLGDVGVPNVDVDLDDVLSGVMENLVL